MRQFQLRRKVARPGRKASVIGPTPAAREAVADILGYAGQARSQADARDQAKAGLPTEDRGVERQARTGDAAAAAAASPAAIAALGGGGQPLPSGERAFLEPRLNASLGGVRIHADSQAGRLADQLSARAFTVGSEVFFAGGQYQPGTSSGRFLLAHELTHVLQQQRGVQLADGVGQIGDVYERQADAVAARVARGEPAAETQLAGHGTSTAQTSGTPALQRYAEITAQPYDRLADDGKLAVKDHQRDAWAESANIGKSNKVLDTLNAKAKIEELAGSDITVSPPGKTSKITLKKFRMVDRVGGGETELVDDCGGANQQMLGYDAAGYASFVARNLRGSTEEFTGPSSYRADDLYKGGSVSTTEQLSGEIYIRIFEREYKQTLSRVDALKKWDGLSQKDKDRLSKKYGINQFAVPKVGQGITIGSERDMPGASLNPPGSNGYNFHFGFNLIASGHDYITLEDYHNSSVKYYFDMYGPQSKGQSWAQAPSNTGALDKKTTTMVVQHPESLKGVVNTGGTFFESDPAVITGKRVLDQNTRVVILRRGNNWMKVEVKSGKYAGQSGWILNSNFTDN